MIAPGEGARYTPGEPTESSNTDPANGRAIGEGR
jgi:hypothetical protein